MRLRFNIRDILWLTLVVGMAIGWRIDRARLKADFDSANQAMLEKHQQLEGQLNASQAALKTFEMALKGFRSREKAAAP